MDIIITAGTIVAVLGILIFSHLPTDFVLIGGLTLLLTSGVINTEEALIGFSNPGMITIAALYIVVTGLKDTGSINWISTKILGHPKSYAAAILRVSLPTSLISAFLNNTPVVSIMIPAVKSWSKSIKVPVSKLMIPLSYASILGGICTLLGTSTNLIVNGLLITQTDHGSLLMFDITSVGLPCAIVGIIYLTIFSKYLLPNRGSVTEKLEDPRQYTIEMVVNSKSKLIGKNITEAGLRNLQGVFLAEIIRSESVIKAVSSDEILAANDQLVFVGDVDSVVDLLKIKGLSIASKQLFKLEDDKSKHCLIEAVVSDSSHLSGKTIKDNQFRTIFNAVVIAVARNGERVNQKIGDIVLQPGDNLLLRAPSSFIEQHRNNRNFYLVSEVSDSTPVNHEKASIAVAILFAMIASAASGLISMLNAALLAAGLMMIFKCCTIKSARNNIQWGILLVTGASFGFGSALLNSGIAEHMANAIMHLSADNVLIALVLIFIVTTVLTEVVTNNAAAVLIFPIAVAVAKSLHVDITPFAIIIMISASASFSTPLGYQTNLMVYGPGGYKFTDYFKIGIPMNILIGITAIVACKVFWL